MAIWFWLALASNITVWSIFFYLLSRRRWNLTALAMGGLHLFFACLVSVAPFRSFLDPDYPGLGLGFLRFEHAAATIPATLIFFWAVAAAFLAVGNGRGRWMLLVIIGDLFMALNFGGSTLLEGRADNWRIQAGEGTELTGLPSALILLFLFTMPFVVSAIWAARRRNTSAPGSGLGSKLTDDRFSADEKNDVNHLRLSEHRA
jgi:hypothetical protein